MNAKGVVSGTNPVKVLALALILAFLAYSGSFDTIEYRGEEFRLRKRYFSYEGYKDDPDNLYPGEVVRIQRLMNDARLGPFQTRDEFTRQVFDLCFPGYGAASMGDKSQQDGSTLTMMSVEIPQTGTSRFFVAHNVSQNWKLVDDFVAEAKPYLEARIEGQTLKYYHGGQVIRQKDLL